MARANSLILPRSTVTAKGGYSLPLTAVFTWIGMSGLAFLHRPIEEFLEVRDDEALVTALGDLLDLVVGLDLEEAALAVGLHQGGLGPHLHPERGGRQVLHLYHGAHRAAAGRQVRLHDRMGGVLEQGHDEGRGEDLDARIAERVGGEIRRHDAFDFSRLSCFEWHAGSSSTPTGRARSIRSTAAGTAGSAARPGR